MDLQIYFSLSVQILLFNNSLKQTVQTVCLFLTSYDTFMMLYVLQMKSFEVELKEKKRGIAAEDLAAAYVLKKE